MLRQYQIPKPNAPVEAIRPSWYLFPVAQPQPPAQLRQQPPSSSTPIGGPSVASTVQTYIFPAPTVPRQRSFLIRTGPRTISGATPSVSAQMPAGYQLVQPDRAVMSAWLEARREQPAAVDWIHQGAQVTADTVYQPVPLMTNPVLVRSWPSTVPWTPILGAPASPPSTDVFFLADPLPRAFYYQRPAPRILVRSIRGTHGPIHNPPALPLTPSIRWWRALDGARLAQQAPVLQLTGGVPQQTYVFPVGQPDRRAYYVFQPVPLQPEPLSLTGATVQAWFLYGHVMPERGRWYLETLARYAGPEKQLLGVFTPPPVVQTYLFPLDQPSRGFWYLPRRASEQVWPGPQPDRVVAASFPSGVVAVPERVYWRWTPVGRQLFTLTTIDGVSPTTGTLFRRNLTRRTGSRE